jgi:hypothetical protein
MLFDLTAPFPPARVTAPPPPQLGDYDIIDSDDEELPICVCSKCSTLDFISDTEHLTLD